MQIRWHIRTYLVILVLAVTLPLTGLLVYSLQENYRQTLKMSENSSMRICEEVAADCRSLFHGTQELLTGLAARPLVRAVDPNHCDPLLADLVDLSPNYANLAIADSTGNVICSAIKTTGAKKASVAGSEWFADVKRANTFVAGNVHIGPVSRKQVVVLGQPIRSADGAFTGLIGYSVDLHEFDPFPNKVSLPSGMLISIVDASGDIISRSDRKMDSIGQPFPDKEVLTLARQGKSGVSLIGRGDQARIVCYTGIAGTEWLVIAVQPAERVLHNLWLLANEKYLIAFLLILLGSGLAYYVGRLITTPIDHIAWAAQCISEGRFDTRARSNGPNEIAAVAERFNEMLDAQQRTEHELRDKNVKLEQSESYIRAFMNNSTSVISLKDKEGRYIYTNRQFERMLNISNAELYGKTVHDIFPADVADNLSRNDQFVLHNGQPLNVEEELPGTNGMRMFLSVRFPLRKSSGEVYAICLIANDITERKRAENDLRQSEERFRQLFEQNEDAVVLFEPTSGRIIDANPSSESLYGYCKEELFRNGPPLFLEPPGIDKFNEATVLLKTEGNFNLDLINGKKKDGTKILLAIHGQLLTINGEEVVYCSFRDVTRKHELELATRNTHSKLIHINKMTSMGMLVSGIAHEINNPNSIIITSAATLEKIWRETIPILVDYQEKLGDVCLAGFPLDELKGTVPRLLKGSVEGARRISAIVNNLRDFARGDTNTAHGSFDINAAIRATAMILSHHIHRHTDSFRMELPDSLPPALGNALQVEQVVINLLMNALQALTSKSQGVVVSSRADQDSGMIEVSVSDEGKGMTTEVLERLTEPFFSTKIDQGGSGLGLSISDIIIKGHNGTLRFESAPDKGTQAIFTLPVAPDNEKPSPAMPTKEQP